MTEKARKMIRSRSGNAPPVSIANGNASAAASETAPRIPVQATITVSCQG